MICTGAGERSALCWECFINLPPPPYLNYFCQRRPRGGREERLGERVAQLWLSWYHFAGMDGIQEGESWGASATFVLSQKLVAARVECLGDFSVVKSPEMWRERLDELGHVSVYLCERACAVGGADVRRKSAHSWASGVLSTLIL